MDNLNVKPMDDHQFPGHGKWNTAVGFICGGLSAIGHSLVKGTLLQVNLSDWGSTLLLKLLEVSLVACLGGAMGVIGKKLVEKYLFKKSK